MFGRNMGQINARLTFGTPKTSTRTVIMTRAAAPSL